MWNQTIVDLTIGTAIGVVSALALSRIMSSLLYGVTPTDPIAFVSIVPPLLVVAMAAAFMPIRRALAVEPTEALRYE